MVDQLNKPISPRAFFATHLVFRHEEFVAAHTAGGRSPHTSNALLAQGVANGRLLRVRRGIYATVPEGSGPRNYGPYPFLVASKLREDAVLAYHSALALHGKAYSVSRRVQYLTASRDRPFSFQGYEYVGIQAPLKTRRLPDFGGGVLVRPHAGATIRVASLERCLVDLLHTPEHGGDWEEIWRSLETIELLDLGAVVELTLRMESALTAGRVGFLLEQHREQWRVDEAVLDQLARHAPSQPRYLDTRRESGKLLTRWNLVVPRYVLERGWEEPQ